MQGGGKGARQGGATLPGCPGPGPLILGAIASGARAGGVRLARFLEPKTQCVAEPGLGARVMDRGGSDRTTTGAKSGIVINQKQTKKKPKQQ